MTVEVRSSPPQTLPLSVVVAVYNGERFLRQAMDSILAQTFAEFELIVIDDGSTDATPAILDSYTDARLIRLTNKKNIGQTPSLNIGLEMARGEFIARHDADDVSHPDRFKRQVERLRENPALGLLGTSYRLIDEQNQILEIEVPPLTNAALQERLEDGNCFCHGSVMMRRDYLLQTGPYREAYRVTQDYDLWLRLAEKCQLANLETPLYDFRFDGTTISRNKREIQLAYRRLAYRQAMSRRAGEQEIPFPEEVDLLAMYPPEPDRLLRDARRSAYLFYISGQLEPALSAVSKVKELLPDVQLKRGQWQKWLVARGQAMILLGKDADHAVSFIEWFGSGLPALFSTAVIRQTVAQFYAEQAFTVYRQENHQATPAFALKAIQYDRNWLRNRGLLMIAGKSVLRR